MDKAISNQLGLNKNDDNFRLTFIDLYIFNDKCDGIRIDYKNPNAIGLANKKIKNLESGSTVIIGGLEFENTNGRKFNGVFYNVAIMKIKD